MRTLCFEQAPPPRLWRAIPRMEPLRSILAAAVARWREAAPLGKAGVLAGGGLFAGLVVALVVLAATGSFADAGNDGDLVATPPTSATPEGSGTPDGATGTPRPTRTPRATPTPTPTPTPDPGPPTVRNLGTFTRDYGEPPGASFARIRIPLLGVDAGVAAHTVGAGQPMTAPVGPNDVAWYELSPAWPGMGGRPGEGGNAIFSGHVDYAAFVPYAGVRYSGKGIFGDLDLLSPGDVIEVVYNGQVLRYGVVWKRQMSAAGSNWAEIWSSNVGADSITVFTCGGDFDFTNLTYDDRVVIRAERL
ncbi:MAG: sortase [Dehalococcoidia bacterium]|nr:sortase [Dehalococcoidia bacterium]